MSDNGTGIDPAEQRRIFDPYYQVDRGLTRRSSGCGLGLAIVRFVAEVYRGKVEVSSRPGTGSVFTLRLPEPPPTLPSGARQPSPTPP